MSFEEVIQKYKQLSPEGKQQVDNLLKQLTAQTTANEDEKKFPLFGALKGKIKIAPDFDEPLEDFKDYM